jgi:hypothetical protein
MKHSKHALALRDALFIKSAEFWLILGQPIEAIAELQKLTQFAWQNPWAVRVYQSAAREFSSDRENVDCVG